MRILRRVSVRARAALGAAAAAALAFGLATVWVGHAAYAQWMPNARAKALNEATLLDNSVLDPSVAAETDPRYYRGLEDGEDAWSYRVTAGGYQHSLYALVLADGQWARHDRIDTAAAGHLPPLAADREFGFAELVDIRLPAGVYYDIHSLVGPSPTDRTVTFLRRTGQLHSTAALEELTGRAGLPAQRITVYVMVSPVEARAAQARVTRILGWYLVPGASLFVAAVAWVVTTLALRPVEAIRRRMELIGAGAVHERVPVPATEDEIARLAVTTNATLGRLERALSEQRRLVADASHELRTPLAVIRNSLEVALAHPEQAHWPDVAADALADTERLHLLAEDLLLLARVDESAAGDGTVELHDLVTEQLAERSYGPPLPRLAAGMLEPASVPGSEVLMARVLRNLLDNAVRHAVAEVTVSLRVTDGWAELTVADDGPGIPAADRERVFERFVRLDPSRDRADGGAGLGLALVRAIVQGLGGTAQCRDRDREPAAAVGAELVIRLPTGTP
ncbi:sensor histidine kinase [Kitasatospora sp. NPDC057223]|uniref:sensor histidine kinase n=1 Tax=Kitasatospora sp. NPDC057223 TaxID=3346055 RepID=UPI00362B3E48